MCQALHTDTTRYNLNQEQSLLFRNLTSRESYDKFTGYHNVSIATLVLNIGAEVTHWYDIQPYFGNQGRCPRQDEVSSKS